MKRWLTLTLATLLPLPAFAFTLAWPLQCTLQKTCFIQNFVDHDTSHVARDFACNPGSYDGHDGTDIRLKNLAAMRAGVAVTAAADGVVLGTRNDIPDDGVGPDRKARIPGKECGNGVHIRHADGYRTQYCHMQQGSIQVQTGQRVKAGDVLGNVGLSGQTEFPHLHLGVWKDNVVLDPFTAQPITAACDPALATTAKGLWASPVPYQPTALLGDGFADSAPDAATLQDAPEGPSAIPATAQALVYWVNILNLRAGDKISLSITAPDGKPFAARSITSEKPMATYRSFIGKKNATGIFATGTYEAQVKLERDGALLLHEKKSVRVH